MSQHRNRKPARPMQLVELEARDVPATFVVTTNAESTPGDNFLSLREAVIAANANPGDDTIILTTGTHTLSLAGANEDAAATGDLDITDTTGKTTIESALLVPDAVFTVVTIGGLDRVFDVHPGVQLELKGIAVRDGGNVQNGGGIHNRGELTLNNVDFKSNFAVLRGGAIDNNSTTATVTMSVGKFEGNGANAVTTLPIGGAINVGGGSVSVSGAIFSGNTAGEGGAINARSSTVTITDSFFAFNSAGDGGAIATTGGNLFVHTSQFNDNKATRAAVAGSSNPGGKGGAVLARGEARINRSTFFQNTASGINGQGGALYNTNYLEVVNSTISNNVAGNPSASNPVSVGGGIANTAGTLRLFSSTVVENRSLLSSSVGGGVYNVASVGAVVSGFIQNTIVARNNFGISSNTPDITGTFTSTGGNLIGISVGSSGWIASDYLGTFSNPINPLLGLLGNNGGRPQTRPLLAGSPAQDKGVLNANTPTIDQRGQPRPAGTGVDIGAFEYQPNAQPIAENDFYFTPEDTKYVADGAGVFLNDRDPNGRPLTAELLSGPNFGTLTFNTNGTFVYTPAANFNGTDVFTYRVTNDAGFSAEASAFFNVGAVNDPPVANNGSATTAEDTPVGGTLTASDVENDPLTFALVGAAKNGTAVVNPNGTYTYTPNANFHGTDSFTFRANDGNANGNTATVTITVTPVNDAPIANDSEVSVDEDNELVIVLPVTDVDGDTLGIRIETPPANGSLTFDEQGKPVYVPHEHFNGTDSFTYTAFDGILRSSTATVVITVNPVNDAPVADDTNATTPEDTPVGGTLTANDIENDPLAFALVGAAKNGIAVVNPNGTYSYTPNANFHGVDSFTYQANDGNANSNTATVTITVTPVNDAPTTTDGSAATDEDTIFNGTLLGADVDGDPLTYALVGTAKNGTVAVNANGSYSYTPNANYHGVDSFTFRASDGQATSNLATVTIAVNPVNDGPTLAPATLSLPENSPNGTSVGTIVGADVDGDALTYVIVSGNTAGAFAIDPASGVVTVANSAALDFETTPSFALTVRATDGGGLSAQATVTVNLIDVNEVPPIAIDVLPGNAGNEIRLRTAKSIEVAILSSAQFDARTVDVTSLRFGRTGAEDSIARNKKTGAPQFSLRDVNGDGRLDLVASYDVKKAGFQVGDTRAILTGRLTNGLAFAAEDTIRVRN
ncbi:MAG: tandem-95 repeat protein [Planctomycetia bacterium]|nr:tandem-95 repeat protein [Planctomycetia bacterium]